MGSIGLITAAALVMRLAGFNGWDTPAHLYKIAALRQGGSLLWDNEWYGGAYQMVSYGFVFYWLAQFIDYSVLVVASAAVLPILFYAYMRRIYGVTGVLPAAALAVVLAVYLANGQDPFLFALALTMGGLVAAACDRRVVAALLIGVAGFANPVAVTVGAIFLVAQYLALPERRAGLRRLALYLLPFAVARVVLALFFWEAATYQYRPDRGRRLRDFRRGRRGRRPAVARPPSGPPRRLCLPTFGVGGGRRRGPASQRHGRHLRALLLRVRRAAAAHAAQGAPAAPGPRRRARRRGVSARSSCRPRIS